MANKTDYVSKVIGEAINEMFKPKPEAVQKTTEGTMYAMKKVVNGYMVSVIPEGGGSGTIMVFTQWDEMIEQLRLMMHPQPPIGEGH